MNRGDIWTVAASGDYAGKPRPAVILQDDRFETTASVTICLLTSMTIEAPHLRVPLNPDPENGLLGPCFLMVDKIATVPRSRIGKRVGSLSTADLMRLNTAMLVFLGLAETPRPSTRGRLATR